jgi:eukaryotic-like serine/threonine-protein kinase
MTPERWLQIARIFDEALGLEPERRAAFLVEACVGDDGLRREVETLLSARDRAGEFLLRDAIEIEVAQMAMERTAIPSGQMIGHFEVLAPLGAGAMGEVYRARDTRLERQVALKLLPARFTQDAQRLRRFEREARAASALNHPNIITVYETGAEGAHHFIATEFVEGATLRQCLADGPLLHAEAVAIAAQIADALEAAHAAGIVHRDIKPENIMLRPDGAVKVLDFGIAKLTQPGIPGQHSLDRSTEQGTVIGTPGYMSPEQARGLDVDVRTDLFSLAVVLYEMIAGHAPFRGATPADVIVALLEREPEPLSAKSSGLPPELDEVIAKALAKDAAQRHHSAGELLSDLRAYQATRAAAPANARTRTPRPRGLKVARFRFNTWAGVAVGALSLLLAVGLVWSYSRRLPARDRWTEHANLRYSQLLGTKVGFGGDLSRPAFSPDGKWLAYNLRSEKHSQLRLREIGGETDTLIMEGPWDDGDPVWSPDGKRIAFFSNRSDQYALWATPFPRGEPELIKELDASLARAVAWKRSGEGQRIYYEANHNLFALDLASKRPVQLTQFDPRQSTTRDFAVSPDERHVIYLDRRGNEYYLLQQPLEGGDAKTLSRAVPDTIAPVWFPDGQKIAFCANRTGGLQVHILWPASGQTRQLTFDNDDYSALAVAPDGHALAAVFTRETANITSRHIAANTEVERTSALGVQVLPELSPNGQVMIYQNTNTIIRVAESIFIKSTASGSQAARLVSPGVNARWSPDGESVAFLRLPSTNSELWRVNPQGSVEKRLATGVVAAPFTVFPFFLQYADYSWSPDGTKIAYSSRKSGASNLWNVAVDGSDDALLTANADRQVSLYAPLWSPDSQRLAYVTSAPGRTANHRLLRINMLEEGRSIIAIERESALHLIGWSPTGENLYIAAGERDLAAQTKEAEVLAIRLSDLQPRTIAKVADVSLPTIDLSRDGRLIAFVARHKGCDNIETVAIADGMRRQLTDNHDPLLFYSGLHWSTDQSLFYSKQMSWRFIALIEISP